jgi:hypothetical protein
MTLQLTNLQRAHILAALANVDARTVGEYLKGKQVHPRKRESIELAERTWSQMVADHEEACARRKLAPVGTSDASKGANNDAQ